MKKNLSLIFLFCLITSTLFAQNKITGKITSEDNSPLPGVTIIEEGTYNGTVSGSDGTYAITVSEDATRLVFSFIGLQTQEILINGKSVVNAIMQEDSYFLDEVVTVGYGTVRKSDLTGSVAQVKVGSVEQRAVSSAEQLLQGITSGVLIRTSSGAPGAGVDVQIRGANSLSSSFSPLYVIDGIEMNPSDVYYDANEGSQYESTPAPSPLAFINPNDIESIEILKDASATAIYGSRGANGVIIITTKTGKKGEDVISYDASISIATLPRPYDMLDTRTYMMFHDESLTNDGLDPLYGDPTTPSSYDKYDYDVNWQDQAYQTAISQSHNLTFSGADDKTKYAVTANYSDNEGIIITSFMKRISLRTNVEREIKNGFKLGTNINLSNTDSKQVQQSTGSVGVYSPVSQILQFRPADPAWVGIDSDELGLDEENAKYNPILLLTELKDKLNVKLVQARLYGDLDITKWLSFRSSVSTNYSNSTRKRHWPTSTMFGYQYNGRVRVNIKSNYDFLNENYFTFKIKSGKNRIHGVAGASAHKWFYESIINEASGFETDVLGYESFAAAQIIAKPRLANYQASLASFYGRFNYVFDNKYLITFTGRYDGSSRLGEGNKWAFFPSGAVAWRVSEEEFLKDNDIISNLKLRASYGLTGNQSVAVFQTKSILTNRSYALNNKVITGFYSAVLPNPDLRWEKTAQMNIGFDLNFFENRLNITADYYKKNTTEMLFAISIPRTSGYSVWWKNAGEVENKGWEFSVNGHIIEKYNFRWNMGLNLSANKSKAIEFLEGIDMLYGANIGAQFLGDSPNMTEVGNSLGLFYGYETDGVYQNTDQTADAPLYNGATPEPGDIILVDQKTEVEDELGNITYEKNGKIGLEDKVIIGNPNPDLIFGFNTDFHYKGFTLNMVFNGMLGNDVMNVNLNMIESLTSGNLGNMTQRAYDGRWTGEGTSNYYPRATTTGFSTGIILDHWVEDGSFIRLQNITLSYEYKLKRNSIFRSISPYASASNLFILTKYGGYDPEVQGIPRDPLSPGLDMGTYPLPRTIKLGLNVSF